MTRNEEVSRPFSSGKTPIQIVGTPAATVTPGDQLERLHILTRADCTTRNRRKAQRLQRTYDDLERRIEQLAAQEELDAIRPDLDGNQIQQLLGIGPGREVGEAYRFLLDLRLDRGPLGEDLAAEALRAWWSARS